MGARVVLKDVAALANVSSQTVSRVINGKPDVAEETRRRVWRAARQLGYRPNTLARSLASRRSNTLGLLTCSVNDDFRAEVIMGAEQEARSRGYLFVLTVTEGNPDQLAIMCNLMLERQVDGLLLLTPCPLTRQPLDCDLPIVTLAYPLEGPHVINVDVDNIDGSYQAARHLTSLGHRRIGVVAGPCGWKAAVDRVEGARRALAEVGESLEPLQVENCADWTLEAGYTAVRALWRRLAGLTALICANDWIALGVYRFLREQSLRIPSDVSIVGFDDLPICLYADPPLTSVGQPRLALGRLLTKFLVDAIEHGVDSGQGMLVKAELICRASTSRAAVSFPIRQAYERR